MNGTFGGRYPYQVSVRLTRWQQEEFDRLSQEFRVSRARLLRDAIDLGFKPMVRRLRGTVGKPGCWWSGGGAREIEEGVADGSCWGVPQSVGRRSGVGVVGVVVDSGGPCPLGPEWPGRVA